MTSYRKINNNFFKFSSSADRHQIHENPYLKNRKYYGIALEK